MYIHIVVYSVLSYVCLFPSARAARLKSGNPTDGTVLYAMIYL